MGQPIITEQTYNATPEQIWKALTDVAEMKKWYFDMEGWSPIVGNDFFFYEPGTNKKFRHEGQIKQVIPNKRLQHTWFYPDLSKGLSTVTWVIEKVGDQTKVTNTHEGVETFEDGGADFNRENFVTGWKDILGRMLKEHLEK